MYTFGANQFGQLGFAKNSNMLRKYLTMHDVVPEHCEFRLVAVGPVEEEVAGATREEHVARRDIVAAMEKELAEGIKRAGYQVMNEVKSKMILNAVKFEAIYAAFAAAFPEL